MASYPDLVVVTGGDGDVGSALVARLRAGGVDTLIADLPRDDAPDPDRVELDLRDPTSIEAAAAVIGERLGSGALGLVHCAGVAVVGGFATTTTADLELMYRVNQLGPLLLTRELLPVLQARPGAVVFVGSDAARSGAAGEVAYSATKAAVVGAAKSLARELAASGTTVNVVSPGPIEGRMVQRATAADPAHLERLARRIPLRRLAAPADVAAAASWLLSSEADYVTGQTISVSGGITMH